ncbi:MULTISPECIES: VOC family protein [unclassified Streptomyces]|uniref:VOC family protein n=1 Tax=unclassified Streptomyces TaxID=2593676 RepID=UPI0022385832|nr:VOC family protein [Streptomyces sp. SHP 1-2]MCW5250236.1 VOC family protein [Streptomyces sp. SHP 1-2]
MDTNGFTTCLWFDDRAEEAARFYVSVFENSELGAISHYPENAPRPAGTVLTVDFTANGQKFVALNGGSEFTFNEAVSFQIMCDTQEEIDRYWSLLTQDGQEGPCGWLKDRYGVSWQVVPIRLEEMFRDPDGAKAARVNQAMMLMRKLDLAALERAFAADR